MFSLPTPCRPESRSFPRLGTLLLVELPKPFDQRACLRLLIETLLPYVVRCLNQFQKDEIGIRHMNEEVP